MKYFIKKSGTLIITLLIISLVTFLAFGLIPGDSAMASLGMDASQEQIEALREELGYNKSIPQRYLDWLMHAAVGDFGNSADYVMPVKELLKERFPVTAGLGIISLCMILILSIPLGIAMAKREGRIFDGIMRGVNQVGMAVPPFFLGMILTLVFGILLKWFEPGSYVDIQENPIGYVRYMIFPAIAIAIPKTAMVANFLRSSIIRQQGMDYARTARSKGNTETGVLYHHVLRNALIPVITFLGLVIAEIFAGSVIIEQVFGLPGLGRLLVVAIANRDFAVVQAIVLYMGCLVVLVNFTADLLYQFIDPRVRIK